MDKFEKIFDKIEKIKRQPEHIRLRWAWGMTFFSMIFILIIWFFSIANMHDSQESKTDLNDQQNFLNEFQNQKESIKDSAKEIKNMIDKGQSLQENEGFKSNP